MVRTMEMYHIIRCLNKYLGSLHLKNMNMLVFGLIFIPFIFYFLYKFDTVLGGFMGSGGRGVVVDFNHIQNTLSVYMNILKTRTLGTYGPPCSSVCGGGGLGGTLDPLPSEGHNVLPRTRHNSTSQEM